VLKIYREPSTGKAGCGSNVSNLGGEIYECYACSRCCRPSRPRHKLWFRDMGLEGRPRSERPWPERSGSEEELLVLASFRSSRKDRNVLFPTNPVDHLHRRPAGRVPPNRAEPRSAHLSLFWQTRLRGGLSGAKIPGRRASWRRPFGILSNPDPDGLPSTCDALPDECSLLCKGHSSGRAKLPFCRGGGV
jgi:hypothetical protein